MESLGKTLAIVGISITLLGFLLTAFPSIPFLGKMPGDIFIKREGFILYFPLTTSILLSIVFTVLLRLVNR